MKYIRTKDGIFENDFVHLTLYGDGKCVMEYKGRFYEPPLELKQADTIKELCDCFVFTDSLNSFYQIEEDENAVSGEDIICYGAIWTDKGLIYVAKMNEEGEFELL